MDGSIFNESKILLSCLMAQRLDHARQLLSDADLPKGGRKEELEARIAQALLQGQIDIVQIIDVLDRIEAWGRQHVYLYDAPETVPVHLRSKSALQAALDKAGWNVVVNSPASLALPQKKTVRLVSLSPQKLRFEFVEARPWTERLPSLDREEVVDGEDVAFQAIKKRLQRAVSAFEWDFVAGTAELFIHRLPSGTKYDKEEAAFRDLLSPIVDLNNFDVPRLKRALAKLKDANGVRERKTNYLAANGFKIGMQSADRATTLGADPDVKKLRDVIKGSKKFGAAQLNCFWELDGRLLEEVHTTIDSLECRVGFLGQYSEESVRDVLSRIRRASR